MIDGCTTAARAAMNAPNPVALHVVWLVRRLPAEISIDLLLQQMSRRDSTAGLLPVHLFIFLGLLFLLFLRAILVGEQFG